MKRVLKNKVILAIAVMLLMANGIYAQILTDYQNVAETSYQTAGLSFRLYVQPDPVYSPTYAPATNTNINANARWTWTYPAGLTGAPLSGVAGVANQNYVDFANPAVGGPYTVQVAESNTVGGCIDATPINQVVQIIAAPAATILTADPPQACGDQLAMAVNMTFTEAVPVAWASYAFGVSELVENIDPSNVVLGTPVPLHTFVDFPTTGKLKAPALTGGASPYGYSFNTSALNVLGGLRTRYTYTLTKASNAGGADGVISAISQKSDYPIVAPGSLTTYAFTDNQIVIIVNPTPTTGPIYHIPNTFAY
jgi:hypothetical protein